MQSRDSDDATYDPQRPQQVAGFSTSSTFTAIRPKKRAATTSAIEFDWQNTLPSDVQHVEEEEYHHEEKTVEDDDTATTTITDPDALESLDTPTVHDSFSPSHKDFWHMAASHGSQVDDASMYASMSELATSGAPEVPLCSSFREDCSIASDCEIMDAEQRIHRVYREIGNTLVHSQAKTLKE